MAILDADKEGFLRSETSLIQTAGRAARNAEGKVILYADRKTGSIRRTLKETRRRRQVQMEYNRREGVTPTSIRKGVTDLLASICEGDYFPVPLAGEAPGEYRTMGEVESRVQELEEEMKDAARRLEFEEAASLRDRIAELRQVEIASGVPPHSRTLGDGPGKAGKKGWPGRAKK